MEAGEPPIHRECSDRNIAPPVAVGSGAAAPRAHVTIIHFCNVGVDVPESGMSPSSGFPSAKGSKLHDPLRLA